MKAFALKYPKENSSQSSEEKLAVLKKASRILRRGTVKIIKDNWFKFNGFNVALGGKLAAIISGAYIIYERSSFLSEIVDVRKV